MSDAKPLTDAMLERGRSMSSWTTIRQPYGSGSIEVSLHDALYATIDARDKRIVELEKPPAVRWPKVKGQALTLQAERDTLREKVTALEADYKATNDDFDAMSKIAGEHKAERDTLHTIVDELCVLAKDYNSGVPVGDHGAVSCLRSVIETWYPGIIKSCKEAETERDILREMIRNLHPDVRGDAVNEYLKKLNE